MAMSSYQNRAAVNKSMGTPLTIEYRSTPAPGPNEVLIEVRAIAFNPLDFYARQFGAFVGQYPAIGGSDIAGTIVSVGSSVDGNILKPGIRVAALAPSFFTKCLPDYGGFQERALVFASMVTPIPDDISFVEGSKVSAAVQTAWAGWYSISKDCWFGGGGSVGSATVQIGKLKGYTVYTTASEKNHEYLKSLGAARCFDYKSENVVDDIVKAAKEDGVTFQFAYDAAGATKQCIDILKALKGNGQAKMASSIPLKPDTPQDDEVYLRFVAAPLGEKERAAFATFVHQVWLKKNLESKEFIPSPKTRLIKGGLDSVNTAIDEWKKGVSGEKIVVQL